MADLSQITLPDNSVYNLKDTVARSKIINNLVDGDSTGSVRQIGAL